MSQAGIIDIEGSHPQIPTQFVTNSGTAIPIANILEILGTTVVAHNIPIETTGSGNTVTIEAQYSSAAASSIGTNAGFASFNSSEFTVDSNGFVSLSGTGTAETITGNTGGSLSPTAGNWNIFGASVAPGTTPVHTSGSGSTLTVDVQIAQAIAATNATNIGLAAFNSSEFTVDTNGFVSLVGNAAAVEKFALQTGTTPVVPASGIVTFNGATVAAGTHPVQTNGTGANTMQLQVQITQAIASTDATKIGLAAFNSADFTVDANGFVTIIQGVFNYTLVDDDASPYTVLSTDDYISCDVADATLTLKFPNAPTTYKTWIVKDLKGASATNNISITTVGGAVTIDGQTTYTIASNFASIQLLFNGTSYEVY